MPFFPVTTETLHVKQVLVTVLRQRPKHRLSRTQTHLGTAVRVSGKFQEAMRHTGQTHPGGN